VINIIRPPAYCGKMPLIFVTRLEPSDCQG